MFPLVSFLRPAVKGKYTAVLDRNAGHGRTTGMGKGEDKKTE